MAEVKLVIPNLDKEIDLLADAYWVDARNHRMVTPALDGGQIVFSPRTIEPMADIKGAPVTFESLFLQNEHEHFLLRRIGTVTLYTPSFADWSGPSMQLDESVIPDIIDIYQGIVGLNARDNLFQQKAYACFFKDMLAAWHSDSTTLNVTGSIYQGLSLLYELGIIAVMESRHPQTDPNQPIPLVMMKLRKELLGRERLHFKEQVIRLLGQHIIHQKEWHPAFAVG